MIRCPLCKNSRGTFFHEIHIYKYYLCDFCQTLFLYPIPKQINIDKFYEDDFDYSAGFAQEVYIRRRAHTIFHNLRKLNPQGISLLDVGSGYGYFLDELNKRGLKTTGLEPSKRLYAYSKKHFNLHVLPETFENYSSHGKKYDFITLIHVIEHVTDPLQTIQKAMSMLNKEGILFIETPNLDSHLFASEQKNYTFLLVPDHIWIFSLKSFSKLFEKIKEIKIEKSSTYSQSEHCMGILKHSSKMIVQMEASRNIEQKNIKKDKLSNLSRIKILLFDKGLAKILTPLLNIRNKGSVLEMYVNVS